jgi:hypothetical protein
MIKNKTLATWLAFLAGPLGGHRFYLHGLRDPWAWLLPLPTLLGVVGVVRARNLGLDDRISWGMGWPRPSVGTRNTTRI